MPKNQPEESGFYNVSRYQSKYLHISLEQYTNKKEFVEFFSSKGLEQIALFQKSEILMAFLIFDVPKDFKVITDKNIIISPNYLQEFLGPVKLETFSKNKFDFDAAVKQFQKTFVDKSFKPLLYTEDNFFINLLIKDFDYFTNLFELRSVEKMNSQDFKYHVDEFKLTSNKLIQVVKNYWKSLDEFNSILMRRQEPTIKSVFDPKINRLFNNLQSDFSKTEVQDSSKDQILDLQAIDLSENLVEIEKVSKPVKYEGFMSEYEPVINQISQKDEYNQIQKTLSIEDQGKILNIFQKDMVDNLSLEYLIGFDQLSLGFMIDVFQLKNNINLSRTRNKVLRLIAMYVSKKALPKSSDPNEWIVALKTNMPNTLLQFYKKYVKKI